MSENKPFPKTLANAAKAYDGTYGIGVNPEAVRELLQATNILLGQFEKEAVSESNIIAINRARAAIKKATL